MTNPISKTSRSKVKIIQRVINIGFVLLMAGLFTSFLYNSDKNSELNTEEITTVTSNPLLGQLAIFPYNFAPRGWAKCDGQLLPINQYQALFSLLGTTFGGDGRTTFGLPDLRGRVPIGYGNGPGLPSYNLGQKAGQYQTILTANDLASHTHTGNVRAKVGTGDESNPKEGYVSTAPTDFYAETHNTLMAPNSVVVNASGNGQAFENMQPYLALGYYIALQGVFPSRN